jgi:L-iditol 2-dehydrogenase
MAFREAAMLEAVSVALHAVHLSGDDQGMTALVIGAGMIGLLTMQAARALGYAKVIIADIDATRLELARTLGADAMLHLSGEELIAAVFEKTGGHGADVVLEAVGRNATVGAAIDCVRKGGTVVLIGNISPEVTLPLQKVVSRQLRLQGSAASCGEYPEAMEMVTSGRIRIEPLITAVASLEEGPRWFERLHSGEPNLMKVVLTPDPAGAADE